MSGYDGSPSDREDRKAMKWWRDEYRDPVDRGKAAFAWAERILAKQALRYASFMFDAMMYEDRPYLGLQPYNYTDVTAVADHLRLNAVRAVTDTYVSLITASKPKPRVLTTHGDYSDQLKAKGLQRWYEGKLEEIQLYPRVAGPGCKQAAAFGTAFAHVYRTNWQEPKESDVCVELAFPWEMLVDDASAQNPDGMRTIGRRKFYERDELAALFPKHEDYILEEAGASDGSSMSSYDMYFVDAAADLVPVIELWHLPYSDGKGGGHCIIVGDELLHYDKFEGRKRFPFATLYRSRPTIGMWGASIPHELRGAQQHINTTLVDIEECLHLYAKPKWLAPSGSVVKAHLDDDIDGIIEYDGTQPPVIYSPKAMPDEQYTFLWQIWQKCFDQIGVSQQRSEGEVAPGLSGSGASIRAWNDVGTGRMFEANSLYEQWHMEIFARMVDEGRAIAEDNPKYASAWGKTKKSYQLVKFRDVDPGEDCYRIRTYPEARLSAYPAQRNAQLQEWFNSGIISPKEFRMLAEFPDLEEEDSLANAPIELANWVIAKFLDADDPEDPEAMVYPEADWPLDDMAVRVQFAKLRALIDGVDLANIRLFTTFLRLVDQVKTQSAAKMQPSGAPGAAPGSSPTPAMTPGAPPAAPPPALQPGQAMPAPQQAA